MGRAEASAACFTDGQQTSTSSGIVFGSEGDQTTRGALLDMLLLGMTNESGAGVLQAANSMLLCCSLLMGSGAPI